MRWTALFISTLALACSADKPTTGKTAPKSAAPASAKPAPESAAAPASQAPPSKAAAPTTKAPAVTVAPVEISATLDDVLEGRRAGLAIKILDGKLRGIALRDRSNAPVFLDLAAKHPHPKVVAGALGAMSRTFTRRAGRGTVVDEDYRKVVRVRLRAKNPEIRLAAIEATRLLLSGKPEAPFVDLLLAETLNPHGPTRTQAVRQLVQLPVVQTGEPANDPIYAKVMAGLLAATKDAPPATLISVMERLARPITRQTPHFADFAALAVTHRASDDPGVRGAANLLFAQTASDKTAAAKALLPDLKHANGYVRGATIEALALINNPSAVHAIMPLVDDTTRAVHTVKTEPNDFPLLLDLGRQVGDVALGAVQALSKKGFSFKRVDLKRERQSVIDAAKAWYKKAGSKRPPL